MRHLPRIIVIAIAVYLLLGGWWVIGLIRDESLYRNILGWIYGLPILLAAVACLAVFRRWMKSARILALIAIAPAIPIVFSEGVPVLGYPLPLRIPITLGLSLFDRGFYGLGIELIPTTLFTAAWFLIKPAPSPDVVHSQSV